MVAIVVVAVFMSLIAIERSGGFCDWKWMKNGANPNMCLHKGCIFCGGEKSIYVFIKENTPHKLFLPFFFFCEHLK